MKSFSHENYIKLGLLLSFCCYVICNFIWGERLPVQGGLGWDGVIYGAYAKNFIKEISTNSDAYHVSRCLPSFIIWLTCKLFHIQLESPSSIFNAFYVFNNICFLLIAWIWNKICVLKKLSFETFVFGFLCFFCNFVVLKQYQYCPAVTDVFALLLGICALYFYIKKSFIALNLLLIPTMLTWPIGIVFIFILSVFHSTPSNLTFSNAKNKLPLLFAFIYGIALIILSKTTYIQNTYQLEGKDIAGIIPVISAILAALYFFVIVKEIKPRLLFSGSRSFDRKNFFLYVFYISITILVYRYLLHLSPNHHGEASATSLNLILTFLLFHIPTAPLIKPGIFITMQVATWGPATLMFIAFCGKMFKKAYKESTGIAVLLAVSFYFSLNPQYRFNTFLMPITIYLLCLSINDLKINLKTCLSFAFIALFSSKVYYSLNVGIIPTNPTMQDLYTTGLQRLFMNTGYWVSWHGYFITLAMTIATGLLLGYCRMLGARYQQLGLVETNSKENPQIVE